MSDVRCSVCVQWVTLCVQFVYIMFTMHYVCVQYEINVARSVFSACSMCVQYVYIMYSMCVQYVLSLYHVCLQYVYSVCIPYMFSLCTLCISFVCVMCSACVQHGLTRQSVCVRYALSMPTYLCASFLWEVSADQYSGCLHIHTYWISLLNQTTTFHHA